ncbi:LysE family transporter [Vibrio sp. RE88]|uniref:LysE family translocator n=1 Tax=Vibrio sp. RE88 TaxID=2607610 RepID=UPI001493B645|nr:LysE family transporter [Vibrio sp. RE88]NOH61532.1 lysine transporter LysE [Vibrio sp. RE88]
MEYMLVIAHVAVIWMLAVITPGANVLLTINTSLQYERKLAMFSALGVSAAVMLWGLMGGSGLVLLLSHFPQLFTVLKVIGGMYLLYLGFSQIYKSLQRKRGGKELDSGVTIPPSEKKVFFSAFLTSILNPKTGFFVVSLFSVSMPQELTLLMMVVIMMTMSLITLVWHLFLAVAFSHRSAKSVYQKISVVMDYVTGGLFTFLGIKIMAS